MAFLAGIGSWILKDLIGWLLNKLSAAITFAVKWHQEKTADDSAVDKAVDEDQKAVTKDERDKAADDITHTGF